MKSPLELMASALRALGAETDGGMPLLAFLDRMGEPLFQLPAPSGFPDRADAWMSSSSLLARLNFATLLASNRIRGTAIDWSQAIPQKTATASAGSIDDLSWLLLGTRLSVRSRQAILSSMEAQSALRVAGDGLPLREGNEYSAIASLAALVIGSPEFQRR